MARAQPRYVCQDCGSVSPKWSGRCEDCGAWNTIVEESRHHLSGRLAEIAAVAAGE